MTLESRRKMSVSRLGQKHTQGYKHSPETRLKISLANKGKCTGARIWCWKGGVTPENEKIRHTMQYREWRLAVFTRDHFTCVHCGDDQGGNLEADHIKPFCLYPALRFEISNGRTLCKKCHKETDTFGIQKRYFEIQQV